MTVSNKKLVDLLVQKTGLDKEQVEEQLQQLKEKVHTEVEKNGILKVQGLGEFSQIDGSLYFKAEEDLETEINYKYAGMKPLELIGAYKDTTDEKVTEEKEESATKDSVFGIEQYQDETEPEEEPIEELIPSEEQIPDEPEEALPDLKAEEETASFQLDDEVVEEEEQQQVVETVKEKAAPAKQEEETQKDPIGKMLVAAVIVIALGVSGWLVYDIGFEDSGQSSNGSNSSEGQLSQNVNVAQNEDPGEIDTGSSQNGMVANDSVAQSGTQDKRTSEQNGLKPISNETSIAEESRQSIYGLRGGATPRAEDGYTIVVHSMRNEARIRNMNNKLQKEGYRTIISSANVMDTTYWRLGLGQFKSIKDATEAASKLPDPYKGNHFIKRIQ